MSLDAKFTINSPGPITENGPVSLEQAARAALFLLTVGPLAGVSVEPPSMQRQKVISQLRKALDLTERKQREEQEKRERTIIEEANDTAGQDRSRDYGHPRENFQRVADIWTVQLGPKLKITEINGLKVREEITPRDTALMMMGLKLAREVNTPKRDNLVDLVGYVKCLDMISGGEYK